VPNPPSVLSGELAAAMHSLQDIPGMTDTPVLVIGATLSRDPNPATCCAALREISSRESCGLALHGCVKVGTNAVLRSPMRGRLFREHRCDITSWWPPIPASAISDGCKCIAAGTRRNWSRDGPTLYHCRSGLLRSRSGRSASPIISVREMLPRSGRGIVFGECAAQDWQTRADTVRIDEPCAHRCADA